MIFSLRDQFPALKRQWNGYPLIYFDTAATALKPRSVIDAIAHFDEQLGGTVHRGVYAMAQEATLLYQQARHKIANFIGGVDFEEVIFTRGTTASINLLAKSFATTFCQPGDVILLTEIEHHSNLVPWQMVAKLFQLKLEFISVNDLGELVIDKPFPDRTKLVSLAHVSNILGTVHPIKKIVEKAREVGAYVCLDGAQSIPHMAINVRELGVDFFAFSGHKIYGPTGVGVLYGRKDLLSQMQPPGGGGYDRQSIFV